jgi:ABC-type sugar transport system ATPase subunit
MFAARFIGSPQMNLWRLDAHDAGFAQALGVDQLVGSRATVGGIRPEHISIDPHGVPGTVILCETLGRDVLLHVDAAGSRVLALVQSGDALHTSPGDRVGLNASSDKWHFFDAETGLRLQVGTSNLGARSGLARGS